MRCSANGASLRLKLHFHPKRFRKRNLHLIRPSGTFPSRGRLRRNRAARFAEQTSFAPNTETFSAVCVVSVVCLSRLARSPGGLGGRSRIEFIVSPLPRRRHNESHFAAQSPERSFFFPLFLSAEKEKEVIGGDAVGKSLLKVTLLTSGKAEPYMISHGNFWGNQSGKFQGKNRGIRRDDKTVKP